MRTRTAALALTAALAGGAVGAVAVTPASATTSDSPVTSRLAGIKSALSGLVSDGTLTQAQADKVADTLEKSRPDRPGGGGRGFGAGLDAAAKAIGVTTDELRTQLSDGRTLAEVAKAHGVTGDALVKTLVAEARTKVEAAVKDGSLTRARADEIEKNLTQRITDAVNGIRPERGPGGGHRGGWGGGPGSPESPTPSATAAPSSAA